MHLPPAYLPIRTELAAVSAWIRSAGEWVAALAREFRWPLLFTLAIVVAVEVPQRLAASHAASGMQFGGMFWGLNDPPQYLSAMRQGAASSGWLIYDRFTQEPHNPTLLYPLYVGLGKLAWLLGMGMEQAFLGAASFGRAFLLLAAWSFTRLASDNLTARRSGLVTIGLSTGIASVVALVARLTDLPLPLAARELNDPELNTFLVMFTAPHLMLGLGLLLVVARLYAECWDQPAAWKYVVLAAAVLLLGLTNPFTLVPLYAVVVTHMVVMVAWRRRLERTGSGGAAVVLACPAPLILVNVLTFSLDPFWSATYGRQNVTTVPPLSEILLAFGLVLPLAALGIRQFVRPLTPGRLLILVWIPLAFLLMQAPTGIQRRFGIGLHPALALLAAYGAIQLWHVIRSPDLPLRWLSRPVLTAAFVQALVGSSAYTYVVAWTIALAPLLGWQQPPMPGADRASYQPAEVVAAADWLAVNASPDDVVLGAILTGSYVAGTAPGRVYVGHWVGTLDYGSKVSASNWFFSAPLDDERRAFLGEHGIRYVVYGPHERLLGGQPGLAEGIERVFEAPGVEILEVSGVNGVRSEPPT